MSIYLGFLLMLICHEILAQDDGMFCSIILGQNFCKCGCSKHFHTQDTLSIDYIDFHIFLSKIDLRVVMQLAVYPG